MTETIEDIMITLLTLWISFNIVGAIAVQIWFYHLGIIVDLY